LLEESNEAETIRNTNEQQRIVNEDTRKTNELDRKNAEDTRKSNETARIQNEQTRNTNEQIRQQSLSDMNIIINQYKFTGTYKTNVTYKKFNQVEFEGSSYIALVDNTNTPVSDTNTWRIFAQKGLKGDKGDTGAALSILGKLTDASQLPPTGQAGDAYTVNGELYVWSDNMGAWENVGNIKGEKGDTGETGENGKSAYEVAVNNGFVGTSEEWLASLKGEKGDTPDLTEINQKVDGLQNEVTEHLAEYTQLEARVTVLEEGGSTNAEIINGLNREVAYLKLKQEASERIDGGTVFADDFNDTSFGFTLNKDKTKDVTIKDGKATLVSINESIKKVDDMAIATGVFTAGNSKTSKKVAVMDNGWVITAARKSSTNTLEFYVKKPENSVFELLFVMTGSSSAYHNDYSILPVDGKLWVVNMYTDQVLSAIIDVSTVTPGANLASMLKKISGQNETGFSAIDITYDEYAKRYLVAWCSIYDGTAVTNISLNRSNDGVNWGTPERLTKSSTSATAYTLPSISITVGKVVIVAVRGATGASTLVCFLEGSTKNDFSSDNNLPSKYGTIKVFGEGVSSKYGMVPILIASNYSFTMYVAFMGKDTGESASSVKYVKTDDSGVTWSSAFDITANKGTPADWIFTYTQDKFGNMYAYVLRADKSLYLYKKVGNDAWTSKQILQSGVNLPLVAPSSNFSNSELPPIAYLTSADFRFFGNWVIGDNVQKLSGELVYDIPNTIFVGVYVEKIGNLEVSATLNNIPMKSELLGNEYELSKTLTSEAPATLTLHLSRADTSGGSNDAITRILGGRA